MNRPVTVAMPGHVENPEISTTERAGSALALAARPAEPGERPVDDAAATRSSALGRFRSGRLGEIVRFGAVGGIAFVVNNAVFLLVNGPLGWGPTWAKVLSVVVATAASFLGSRYWSFAARKTVRPRHEMLLFIIVNAIGLVIEWIPIGISHYLMGLQDPRTDWFSGVIVGTALGTIFRYFTYRNWVFTGGAKQ